MDVTKESFPAVADTIKDFIKTCDFYAVDTELTGVMVPGMTDGICDPPERNYALKGTVASRYSMIQLGVCTFHKDPKATTNGVDNYIARPFNIFLFPSEHPLQLGGGFDRSLEKDILLNPGAIAFNRRYKMDFQRWIYHGVEYCDGPLERKLEEYLDREDVADAAKKKLAARRDITLESLSSTEEKEYFIKCEQMAAEFMKEVPEEEAVKRPKELMMPSIRSRVAREVTQAYLEATHDPHLLVALRGKYPTRDLCLIRLSSDEMTKLKERRQMTRDNRLSDFVGFRNIFKAMVESKKPVVGHNCLVDILFMLTAFDEPLSLQTLTELKSRIHSKFPLIFDTKSIAIDTKYFPEGRFETKTLEPLYTSYKDKPVDGLPTTTLPLGFHSYDDVSLLKARSGNSGAHEAGYDALITGKVLLNLLTESKQIGAGSAKEVDEKLDGHDVVERSNKSSSPLFDKAAVTFGNRVHLHRSLYLMDLNHRDITKELQLEGGSTDIFMGRNGVAILKYCTTRIAANHVLESRVLSLGYEGSQVIEVSPGLASISFSAKAIAVISKRSGIPIEPYTDKKAIYANMRLVEEAVREINTKLAPTISAEVFIPYHTRERNAESSSNYVLGRCSHPSMSLKDTPSPLFAVPTEILRACASTSNPAAIVTESKRQYHTTSNANYGFMHCGITGFGLQVRSVVKANLSGSSLFRRLTKH